MTKTKSTLAFGLAACLIGIGAAYQQPTKKYPVSHTESEWVQNINGSSYIRNVIRQSNVPANVAFLCDSILEAHILDVNRQVVAAMNSDSTNKKGKP
jgi:hypothetical protein